VPRTGVDEPLVDISTRKQRDLKHNARWLNVIVVLSLVLWGCRDAAKQSDPLAQTNLSAFMGSLNDLKWQRHSELVALCMKKQGFDYIKPKRIQGANNERTHGFNAKPDGYGWTSVLILRTAPKSKDTVSIPEDISKEYVKALTGDGSKAGCNSSTGITDFGGLQTALNDLEISFSQDPDLQRLIKVWSNCVKQKVGVRFEHPRDINPYLQERVDELVQDRSIENAVELFRAEEIKLARVDLDCFEQIEESYLKAVKRLESSFSAAKGDLLLKYKASLESPLPPAKP
jgi:hypothetical protein